MGGDPSRVRVTGPLAVFREGFTGELAAGLQAERGRHNPRLGTMNIMPTSA
jgi:hypothetical protein